MTPATEYTEMKAFLRFFSERFLDQRHASSATRPLAALEKQEQESPARAASGLRMAVNNCLEISSSWPLSQIVALDAEMHARGVLTVSHVRSRVWGRYTGMLKRALVRTDSEWAIAQGVLADASLTHSLPAAERQALHEMARSYALKHPGSKASPG